MPSVNNVLDKNVDVITSTMKDGPMNFLEGNDVSEIRGNRNQFISRKLGAKSENVVTPKPIHGRKVAYVNEANEMLEELEVDGVMTNKKGLALTMTGADCPSVVLYDTMKHVIAIAHCGWKPLVKDVLRSLVSGMRQEYNTNPEKIKAFISPGICKKCFEVKEDVLRAFGYDHIPANGVHTISLPIEITKRLLELGIPYYNITDSGECTKCSQEKNKPKYYSFRRDGSVPLKTQMTAVIMR